MDKYFVTKIYKCQHLIFNYGANKFVSTYWLKTEVKHLQLVLDIHLAGVMVKSTAISLNVNSMELTGGIFKTVWDLSKIKMLLD